MSSGTETTVVLGLTGPDPRPHQSLSVPHPVDAPHRRCEPTRPACPPLHSEAERVEPLPFDKFLARQNQEFRAAVAYRLATRDPCEPMPCALSPPAPATVSDLGAPSRPAASSWPRIGDVDPV